MEQTLKEAPLARPVDLRDLAQACIFLAENESITGQILYVDCGQHL
jgi:enoyl-[acyl-carrier-protein] reductase (NADH)